MQISIVSQFETLGPREKEYGTACPIKCVKDLVGNENFLSVSGDNFYTVEDLKLMNIDDEYTYVAGMVHKNPENFGVLLTEGSMLKEIVEKPKTFVGDLINISLYKFTPEIFQKVMQIEKSPRGEYELTDAISLLAKEGKVRVNKVNDFWMDFGKPNDVAKLTQFLEHGDSQKK